MKRGARFLALQNQQTHYVSDKPCSNGHLALRIASTGTCVECRRIGDRLRYQKDPQKAIQKVQKYYQKHAEQIKEKRRDAYALNPEKEREKAKERSVVWRKENPEKVALQKPLKIAYKKANPHKVIADVAKRRAAKQRRTPMWLTKKDFIDIEAFYKLAKEKTQESGILWHVDHIVPLQGETVSGLHVPLNLRVVPWNENLSKGNKLLEAR